ncbi:pullulanase-associated domain-containing protein [Bacillus salinus]|uniref:pullulanase-associated domain-containing protein n=1 Tax=Bacillus sp. HMF5848 TaxID=2495421 RepID=UPI0021AD7FF2|nr:pullulanase-associated domain-containing protein [Bacillus sp. HMF5848]
MYTTSGAGEVEVTIPANADGGTVLLTVENGLITGALSEGDIPANTLRIHYNRADGNYADMGIWTWFDVVTPQVDPWPDNALPFAGTDSFGAYIDIPLKDNAVEVGFHIVNKVSKETDGGNKLVTITPGMKEIWLLEGSDEIFTVAPDLGVPENHIRIHYNRTNGDYENFGAWLWNDVADPSAGWPTGATMFEKFDDYGAYIDVELAEGAKNIGFLVMDVTLGDAGKDGGDKGFTIRSSEVNEIWIKQGSNEVFTFEPVELPENTVRIHYTRDNGDYENYGVWNWGDVVAPSDNWPTGATMSSGIDQYGAYYDIAMNEDAKSLGFLVMDVTLGDPGKDGGNKTFNLVDKYNRLWIKQGDDTVYISPYGDVANGILSAELLSETEILLGFTMTAGLTADALINELELKDKDGNPVTIDAVEVTDDISVKITANIDLDLMPYTVTYSGRTVDAVKGWRLIDSLYGYDGNDLGATYNNGDATLKIVGTKASAVVANFYDKNDAATQIGTMPLTLGERGVWSLDVAASDLGVADLDGYYYQYEVTNDGVTKKY